MLLYGAYGDFKTGLIENRLIVWGLWAGLTFRLVVDGGSGIIIFLIKVIWPGIIFYIPFLLRGMGAGDIKLFMCISPFLPTELMISVIIISLLIGAGVSCHRILKNISNHENIHTFSFGICIFIGFVLTVVMEGV